MDNLNKEWANVKEEYQKKFDAYYNDIVMDKSLPLEARWDKFIDMPPEFLERYSWIQHYVIEREGKKLDLSTWKDWEHGSTCDIYEFNDWFEDVLYGIEEGYSPRAIDGVNVTEDMINEWKELIMEDRLYSFNYNW